MLERRPEYREVAIRDLIEGLGPGAMEALARLRGETLTRGGPDEIVHQRHAAPGLGRESVGKELLERRLHALLRPALEPDDIVDRCRPAGDSQEGDQLGGIGSGISESQLDDVICWTIAGASGEHREPEWRAGGLRPELRCLLRLQARCESASEPDTIIALKRLELANHYLSRIGEDVSKRIAERANDWRWTRHGQEADRSLAGHGRPEQVVAQRKR